MTMIGIETRIPNYDNIIVELDGLNETPEE